jgi:hypothetical protein
MAVNAKPFLTALLAVLIPAAASAQTTPAATTGPIHLGVDSYRGTSSLPGLRRVTDQLWAGQSTFTPSLVYLRFEGDNNQSARLALGTGDATTGGGALYRQPVEAWWRQPVAGGAVTVGRFFTPFALQEWQYESRDGVSLEHTVGRLLAVAALQRHPVTGRTALYLRGGVSLSDDATIGVSLAQGGGFSYDSVYDRGVALDAQVKSGPLRFSAEFDRFVGPARTRFRFDTQTVAYRLSPSVEPFVARYTWHDGDSAGALGSYRSQIAGLRYQASSWLGIEAAAARTGQGTVAWTQLHLTWEH